MSHDLAVYVHWLGNIRCLSPIRVVLKAQKKFRAVIKGGIYEFVDVWHGNGWGGGGGGGGGGGPGSAFDFVELLQLTPRYQTTYWSNVSQESVKSQLIYCPCSVLYLLVKDRLNVHRQLKQQPITIASVVSVGNVSVNHQSRIMVRYRWCIGQQSSSLVQPRPLAFPCDTRYLSTNTWWTLLVVIHQLRLIP